MPRASPGRPCPPLSRPMADGPLDRARQALQDAKARVAHSPSATSVKALEEARVHMDFLLDTLPIPHTPTGPGAHTPGPVVSSYEDELLAMGSTEEESECDSTTAQQVDGSGAEQ